jgi:hypothetical protein
MKKILYFSVFSLILWSCGGGGDEVLLPENLPPTIPSLLEPTNELLCLDNLVQFKWSESTDPDLDNITYEVQISKDNTFTNITNTLKEVSTTVSVSLDKGTLYYWRVKSKDNVNESNYSSVFNFYTEGEGISNYIPFSPELVLPELNSVIQQSTTILKWKSNDLDIEDTLNFDIYFGMVRSDIEDEKQENLLDLSKYTITQNTSDSSVYSLSEISIPSSSNFYWKVIVKDGNGNETKGQVWNFKTN